MATNINILNKTDIISIQSIVYVTELIEFFGEEFHLSNAYGFFTFLYNNETYYPTSDIQYTSDRGFVYTKLGNIFILGTGTENDN